MSIQRYGFHCPCCGNSHTRSVPAILHNDVRTFDSHRSGLKVGKHGYGFGGGFSHNSVHQVSSSPLVEALTPPPQPKLPSPPPQPKLATPAAQPRPPKSHGRSERGLAAVVGGLGCLGLPGILLVGWLFPPFLLAYLVGMPATVIYLFWRGQQADDSAAAKAEQLEYAQRLQQWHQNQCGWSDRAQARLNAQLAVWEAEMQRWEVRCASIETRWNAAMTCWNALFYCERCDSVFLPQTGEHAPLTQTRELLWKQRQNLELS